MVRTTWCRCVCSSPPPDWIRPPRDQSVSNILCTCCRWWIDDALLYRDDRVAHGGEPPSQSPCDSFMKVCDDGELSVMMDGVKPWRRCLAARLAQEQLSASIHRDATALPPDAEGIESERCLNSRTSWGGTSQLRSPRAPLAPTQLRCSAAFPIRTVLLVLIMHRFLQFSFNALVNTTTSLSP